jgi:hypothetical protein
MLVKLGEQKYKFQSIGLIKFLRLLQTQYPSPINWSDIQSHFNNIDAKQIARFIDALEKKQLNWVAYQTKTRGPFRLMEHALSIELPALNSVLEQSHLNAINLMSSQKSKWHIPIQMCAHPAWLDWMNALLHAQVTLRSNFKDKKKIHDYLENATQASIHLPQWTMSVVLLYQAHFAERNSDYRSAFLYLHRFNTIQRNGYAHPAAKLRANLIRAKIYYDQGKFKLCKKVLNECESFPASLTPSWLNISALIAGQTYLNNQDEVREIEYGLTDLLLAMGSIFLDQGDLSKLDVLSFNFANNLLRALRNQEISKSTSELVLSWFLSNRMICSLIQVGDDSILHELLIFDLLQEFGPPKSDELIKQVPAPNEYSIFIKKYLVQARIKQNRLEIAHCLIRQFRLEKKQSIRAQIYDEASALLIDLNRKDLLTKLNLSIKVC